MSSYNSPLPVGSAQGTGAAAIAIAETAGGTTTNGNATDSAGNVKVDFVWGNQPMHPNDVRTEEAAVNVGGTTGSNQLAYQTAVVTAASASAGAAPRVFAAVEVDWLLWQEGERRNASGEIPTHHRTLTCFY